MKITGIEILSHPMRLAVPYTGIILSTRENATIHGASAVRLVASAASSDGPIV